MACIPAISWSSGHSGVAGWRWMPRRTGFMFGGFPVESTPSVTHLPDRCRRSRVPAQSVPGHLSLCASADGDPSQPPQPTQIPPPARDEPLPISPAPWTSTPMTKYLQESRMREIRTSGSTRGSNGSAKPPVALYSTVEFRGHSVADSRRI